MMGVVRRAVPETIRRRYALKFVIVLLALGCAVALIGAVGTAQLADEVRERVHGDQETLAAQEARNVEQWNERNLFFVDRIAAGVGEAPDAEAYLESVAREEDGVHDVHYVSLAEGAILESTNADLAGGPATAADEPWVIDPAVLEGYGRQLFDDPLAGEAHDGTPVLIYGQFVGDGSELVLLLMDMAAYADEMISSEGSVSHVVYDGSIPGGILDEDEPIAMDDPVVVMDTEGEAFFEPYGGKVPFGEIGLTPELYEIGAPDGALERSAGAEYADDEFLATAVQVTDDSDWFVAIHTPEREAYGFVNAVSEYGGYASLAGLLVVVLVGGVVGRSTSRSVERLTEKAERMEAGDLDVSFDTGRVDEIGRLYDGFASMRDSLSRQIGTANEQRERAERARAETERLNRRLEAEAADASAVMAACADGDLTARMDPGADTEAMAEIAADFNEMIAEIEATTARLEAFATAVTNASEEVTASSEEVRSLSESVAGSVEEIAEGADRQFDRLGAVDDELNALSTTTEQIAASSNEVADLAERTAETGQRGREAARAAVDGMRAVERESEGAVAEIDRLEAEMEQIDELTEFIAEVASQTNMLALNANIEAARSGSTDAGFSAVAEEVKELAEETKAAAGDIEERLERIQAQTERTAAEVQATSDRAADHAASVEEVTAALDEIADYAGETNRGVQEISAATQQQASSTEEVVSMVAEATTIAEETAAESEAVAAAAQQQAGALAGVTRSAETLAGQATELSAALDRFETDVEVDLEYEADEIPAAVVGEGETTSETDDSSATATGDEDPIPLGSGADEDGDSVVEGGDGEIDDGERTGDEPRPEDVFTFGEDR